MVNLYPYLVDIKNKIDELNIYKSIKIGLERGADKSINTPLCRIVLESVEYKGVLANAVIQIVIALDTKNDYEKLYSEFLDFEYKTKNKLLELPYNVVVLNTITDEDRLSNLKAGIIRISLNNLVEYK
jgi:hypothetical protein